MGAQIVKNGFNRFTGQVRRLRMRDMNTENGQKVSPKGVGEGTKLEQRPGISFSMNDNDITVNSSDQLKPLLLVNHSPKEIAKLQRNDSDVG
ncbi:hypothetical protein DPMN_173813 [Dreissena polymorpha]|uniref:Uncharacterized protein n=1 Tax=Dreissena polymorpha TaxID=45954 RepID=A0A9D4IHZ6_DREPO|nr:hypothetical protein DPMN_173813 [Dreissena polymorpha]